MFTEHSAAELPRVAVLSLSNRIASCLGFCPGGLCRARLFDPSLRLICLSVLCFNSCEYFDRINFEDCPSSGKCAGIEE